MTAEKTPKTTKHYDVRSVDPVIAQGHRMTLHVRALDVPRLIAKLASGLAHYTGNVEIANCLVSVAVDGEFTSEST